MATSQPPNEEAKKAGEMFAVCPKSDCPHVQHLISSVANLQIDVTSRCKDCGNAGENWVCLKCSEVYCSRYVNSHMVEHNQKDPSHMVALSFSDISVWCYDCDSYIQSPALNAIIAAAQYAKFDNPAPLLNTKQLEPKQVVFKTDSLLPKEVLLSRARATLYGNCIGDAIGLLTEFMTKEEAQQIYSPPSKKTFLGMKKKPNLKNLNLEYKMKHDDMHRFRWEIGDWTDDSDQMILILRSLLECDGKIDIKDFVAKFLVWVRTGYRELGDHGGMGIGATTNKVVRHPTFKEDPHKSAFEVWEKSGKFVAPNGGVMRTSILGLHDFTNIDTVIENTRDICKVTHADPRCIASCVAVTTAIALMLQGKHCDESSYTYDEMEICNQAYEYACKELETTEQKKELKKHMFASSLAELKLDDEEKIGYTYKCLGSGFWAYRQRDFRRALTELVMEGGDADTNGAVAGALLGCKLGVEKLPESWLNELLHKKWLDDQIDRYFAMIGLVI